MRDLVLALMRGDELAARQWMKDAKRARVDLASLSRPRGLDEDAMAVAAALVELFAQRRGRASPDWTRAVGAAKQPIYLCSSSRVMRRVCEKRSPDVLRRRNVFAPGENYLDV